MPSARPAPARGTREYGAQLAGIIASSDAVEAQAAVAALHDESPIAAEGAARVLARLLKQRGPEAERICLALTSAPAHPRFGGRAFSRLLVAFGAASRAGGTLGPAAEAASQALYTRGLDHDYVKRLARARAEQTPSSARQLLSVFTRVWVMAVYYIPAFFLFLAILAMPSHRLDLTIAFLSFTLLIFAIDAWLRRCSGCRRFLAGQLLSFVQDQYGYVDKTWKCIHCGHRWQS